MALPKMFSKHVSVGTGALCILMWSKCSLTIVACMFTLREIDSLASLHHRKMEQVYAMIAVMDFPGEICIPSLLWNREHTTAL